MSELEVNETGDGDKLSSFLDSLDYLLNNHSNVDKLIESFLQLTKNIFGENGINYDSLDNETKKALSKFLKELTLIIGNYSPGNKESK